MLACVAQMKDMLNKKAVANALADKNTAAVEKFVNDATVALEGVQILDMRATMEAKADVVPEATAKYLEEVFSFASIGIRTRFLAVHSRYFCLCTRLNRFTIDIN